MLFSATSTQKIEDLARLALKKEPIVVGVEDVVEKATVEGLEQGYLYFSNKKKKYFSILCLHFSGYVVCPAEKRFLMLFSFLKRNRKKKIMVFFSSCLSVKFHHELLNYIDMPVMCIHVRFNWVFVARLVLTLEILLIRVNKSKLNERQHFSNFVMRIPESSCVRMWLQEGWISQQSIGSFSMIHLMILRYFNLVKTYTNSTLKLSILGIHSSCWTYCSRYHMQKFFFFDPS